MSYNDDAQNEQEDQAGRNGGGQNQPPRYSVPTKPHILKDPSLTSLRIGVASEMKPEAKAEEKAGGAADKASLDEAAAIGTRHVQQTERFRTLINDFRKQREQQGQASDYKQEPKPLPEVKDSRDIQGHKPSFTLPSDVLRSEQRSSASGSFTLPSETRKRDDITFPTRLHQDHDVDNTSHGGSKQSFDIRQQIPDESVPDNEAQLNQSMPDQTPKPQEAFDLNPLSSPSPPELDNSPTTRFPNLSFSALPTGIAGSDLSSLLSEPKVPEIPPIPSTSDKLANAPQDLDNVKAAPVLETEVALPHFETDVHHETVKAVAQKPVEEDLFKPFVPRSENPEGFVSADDAVDWFKHAPDTANKAAATGIDDPYKKARRQRLGKHGHWKKPSKVRRFGMISLYVLIAVTLTFALMFALAPSLIESLLSPKPVTIAANIDDTIVSRPDKQPDTVNIQRQEIFTTDEETLSNDVTVVDNQEYAVVEEPTQDQTTADLGGIDNVQNQDDQNLANSIDSILAAIEQKQAGVADRVVDQSITVVEAIDLKSDDKTPNQISDKEAKAEPKSLSDLIPKEVVVPDTVEPKELNKPSVSDQPENVSPEVTAELPINPWLDFNQVPKPRVAPQDDVRVEEVPRVSVQAEPVNVQPNNDPNAPVSITIPFGGDVIRALDEPTQSTQSNNSIPSASSGSQEVQISSHPSRNLANAALESSLARYFDIADQTKAYIRADSLQNGATVFRVLLGSYASRDEANRVCNQIKERGGDCFRRQLR